MFLNLLPANYSRIPQFALRFAIRFGQRHGRTETKGRWVPEGGPGLVQCAKSFDQLALLHQKGHLAGAFRAFGHKGVTAEKHTVLQDTGKSSLVGILFLKGIVQVPENGPVHFGDLQHNMVPVGVIRITTFLQSGNRLRRGHGYGHFGNAVHFFGLLVLATGHHG